MFFAGTSSSYPFNNESTLHGSFAVTSINNDASISEPIFDTNAIVIGDPSPNIKVSVTEFSFGIGKSDEASDNTACNIMVELA